MKKKEKGILSVEASIVLTFCLLFILFIFSFARVYNTQSLVSHAIIQATDAIALESFLREETLYGSEEDVAKLANRFLGTSTISAESYTSLRSADVAKIAKEKFINSIASSEKEADTRLKKIGVKNGVDGIDFSASRMELGNDNVIVYARYTIKMQFGVLGMDEITVTKAAKSKTFGDILFGIEVIPEDPIKGSATGSGNYKYGTEVKISATPSYGYKFKKWSDGNTDNPRTITVTDAKTYVAMFEQSEFGLNIECSPKEGGSASGDGLYKYLDSASITATPANGYHFSNWKIYAHKDKTTKNDHKSTTSVGIDQSYTCTAYFAKNSYTVNVETTGTSDVNAYIVYNNNHHFSITSEFRSNFKLSAPAISGYAFLGWKEKDSTNYFSASSNVNMNIPAKNITYVAVYQANPKIKIKGGAIEVNSTQLTAEVTPENVNVIWESSNPDIVSVDSTGLITARGNGNATIYAYFVYNGVTYSDSKNISTQKSVEVVNYCRRDRKYNRHFYKYYPGPNYSDKLWDGGDGVFENRTRVTWSEVTNALTIKSGAFLSKNYIQNHTSTSGQWQGVYNPQQGYNSSGETGYVLKHTNGYDMIFFIETAHAPNPNGGYYDYYISQIK